MGHNHKTTAKTKETRKKLESILVTAWYMIWLIKYNITNMSNYVNFLLVFIQVLFWAGLFCIYILNETVGYLARIH